MAAGSPKSIKINGISFPIVGDGEPKVVKGGRYATETVVFGDGSSRQIVDQMYGKITDLQVDLSDGRFDELDAFANQADLTIVYESSGAVYEGTGHLIFSDGLMNNTRTEISETFEIHSSTADGFRLV
jgi:hypothetical protein